MTIKEFNRKSTNILVEAMREKTLKLLDDNSSEIKWKRLHRCDAYYCKIDTFYILKSFQTIIAIFDVETKQVFDFLRLAYGYTATSNQHYWKFKKFVIEENSDVLTKDNYTEWRWK